MVFKTVDWLKHNETFLLIMFLFLPEYLFYPALLAVSIYVLRIWIRDKAYKFSIFWILWLYLFIIAWVHQNTKGMFVSFFLIILVAYAYVLLRNMNASKYASIQYFIVWSSLFNFFFNFIRYKPFFAKYVYQLVGYFVEMQNLRFYGDVGSYRAFSTFGNPNLYAFILLIVLLICFNQIQFQITFRNYSLLFFYSGAFIVNLYAMLITGTRAILPALLLGFLVILLIQGKWMQIKVLVLIGACAALFVLLKPSLLPRFFEMSEAAQLRYGIWESALSEIRKSPWFGRGFFSYTLFFTDAPHAHNIFIESLLSFGIVGTFLFLIFAAEKIWLVLRDSHYLDYPVALALLVATIFYGIFDVPLLALQPSFLFVAVLLLPIRKESELVLEKEE